MSEPMIQFEGVTKSFPVYANSIGSVKSLFLELPSALKKMKHRYTAIQDINFTINRGETVGFVGRNGAGKSTMLGLIAGVMRPDQGRIRVNGRVSPLLELGGGFHPDLSGLENIQLNGVILGLSRKEVAEKLPEIIEFSELGDFVYQPVRSYSSGMMARLGFSVVVHLKPEILLIDEVLAVGDAHFQQKCMKRMQDFKGRGVTIAFVSHNAADVQFLCERTIWIDDHRVRMDGPTEKVIPEYLKAMGVAP